MTDVEEEERDGIDLGRELLYSSSLRAPRGDTELVYQSLSPLLFIQLLYCSYIHTAAVFLRDRAALLVILCA